MYLYNSNSPVDAAAADGGEAEHRSRQSQSSNCPLAMQRVEGLEGGADRVIPSLLVHLRTDLDPCDARVCRHATSRFASFLRRPSGHPTDLDHLGPHSNLDPGPRSGPDYCRIALWPAGEEGGVEVDTWSPDSILIGYCGGEVVGQSATCFCNHYLA